MRTVTEARILEERRRRIVYGKSAFERCRSTERWTGGGGGGLCEEAWIPGQTRIKQRGLALKQAICRDSEGDWKCISGEVVVVVVVSGEWSVIVVRKNPRRVSEMMVTES